ncbi:mechanosensitive channel MscK [Pseudomonas sp. 5P_3.1_Bac2]|uniref:mechanosensitive channel MscK n=1 Tax=Pseudomonas sp. 5P_3.1_Bac2 TaxID=2971617 RepID=UPI0021C6C7B2|nr:mechanosensitive channel MscK [Pseudomonas sp. 5P_3.1_Bac2]MCU1718362.1 mechanosensitive channel MscK [Pseudomonas sp. 5P_3.1_Bac2]
MSFLRSLACIFALLACFASTGVLAADVPTAADVQKSLDGLAARKLPEAEQQALKQTLEQTLAMLTQRTDSINRLEVLEQLLDQAPRLISDAQQDLAQLKAQQRTPINTRYGDSSLEKLEEVLAERNTQMSTWQQQVIEANSLIITAQTRPERAQADISSNQTRTLEITGLLKGEREASKPLTAERRDLLKAELSKLEAQNKLSRQELAGNSLLQDLGTSRRNLLDERIKRGEQALVELQSLINEKRHAISEETVAQQSLEAEKAGSDSLLAKQSAQNLQLSDYLLKVTDRLNQLTHDNLQTKQQLDSLSQSGQALEQQISVLKGSLLLSRILYKQQQALPQLNIGSDITDEIADLRLKQFELTQQREAISNPTEFVDQLLSNAANQEGLDNAQLRTNLLDIINTRRNLIDQLNRELSTLLNESITLQLNQNQLQSTASALRATLDEQMFWIPSNKPLNQDWLKNAPQRLQEQVLQLPWGSNLRQLAAGLTERPLIFLPLLLLIGVLLWRRNWLRQKLDTLNVDICHFKKDSQLHTPLALLMNVLLALPGTLFLALCGYALQIDARGENASLAQALYQMAEAWLVFYTLYRILVPNGVAELHFRWAPQNVAYLNNYVRKLGLVVLALVAVVTIAEQQPAALTEDVIGLGILLIGLGLMTWLMGRILLVGPLREHGTTFHKLVGIAFTALPLLLIVAIGFGYYYTALKLTDRLIDTLYLLILWLILDSTFARGLTVAARRLAYQRAMAKRQAQAVENEDGNEVPIEEPTLDIEQINQQSMRLIRLALSAAFIACLYWIWADLISVFTYLDNIVLYQYSSGAGGDAAMVPMSVLDVIGALIVSAITVILARNLPGLLEVLVLSRLKLAQGSAYATTTLLSYAIAGFGISTTLSILGVSWDKLQWLVAALSVGIGFGMQAIFANFISGLILLFERPIRIGDTVTIGTVTGTVNRIRIRATHITDSDRKAVVVPNQILLTSQLINWTLTDTTTRLVLQFTVNRGADLEEARTLLLQAAQENSRVLRDPMPGVQLMTYGTTTLGYELKVYVRELSDRSLATDELNRRVDQLFYENGINLVSTTKMEVTLVNSQGQETTLPESAPDAPAPQA